MKPLLASYVEAIRRAALVRPFGQVRRVAGLLVEAQGLQASVGEMCTIDERLLAEVVAVRDGGVAMMAYGSVEGLATGSLVRPLGRESDLPVGPSLLGRVVDGFCKPLDDGPALSLAERRPLRATAPNPMHRPRIDTMLEMGVRAIDTLLTVGRGQRMGIFAGSGVGKSTLLGMIARHVRADVNVIALVGERGREVKEFIDRQLGPQGLARSVVVVAASDQPALARIRAAYAAVTIAEYFRDQGKQVLLTMDSVTRFAMARREVGLAAGEPPTARGYTPSVFAELPQLCERCGTSASGGSITALMTVLVEGDDFNEPVSDCMRSILDGHIVLSRQIAHMGQYPAIDVLQSASRLMPELVSPEQRDTAQRACGLVSLLERNRQLVDIGAYEAGSNPRLDAALAVQPRLKAWLGQREGGVPASESLQTLAAVIGAAREVTA